jgi:L-alanine-DL-glutamate epimerase-like enolase superfamily enzyme
LVVGGEGEGTLHGIRRLLEEEALEVVQTDILAGGGYTGLKRIAALAQAFDVPISPHGAQYPDINCHLMAAVPNSLIMSACPESESYQIWSRMYNPPLKVENGHIAMREQPGLGLELDWEFVERHRV